MTEKHPLVQSLEAIYEREDRAALAALRRGLSSASEASVYPYVARFFPAEPNTRVEGAYVMVASLFALHPSVSGVGLGAALRTVRERSDSASVELRFVALLEAHPEDLGEHLRHAVSLVRSHEIALDWNDALVAVLSWGDERRRSQRRWARDFWAPFEPVTAAVTASKEGNPS